MISPIKDCFISLVKLGIGTSNESPVHIPDWPTIQTLAVKQGLLGLVVDGIERISDTERPPKDLLMQMVGTVVQGYEYRYELYKNSIAQLTGFYNAHGLKMMLLKGYACGLDWPKPEHRPYGDIDIWLFGEYKEADDLLAKEKGIKIDMSHHHHTVFGWDGFTVENHYDFVNVHAHKSSAELEMIFKDLGSDDTHFVDVEGERVYLPSANLHALFLIKHMVSHFTSTSINLRQVLDWAFFVKAHGAEVDWEWLLPLLDTFKMRSLFDCVNAICVEDLGFSVEIFPYIKYDPFLKERVLGDILEPKFVSAEPRGIVPRLLYKYRRWQGNAWKQKLCYPESRWSSFWWGLKAHLVKPRK